jgi:hypothetical protein
MTDTANEGRKGKIGMIPPMAHAEVLSGSRARATQDKQPRIKRNRLRRARNALALGEFRTLAASLL